MQQHMHVGLELGHGNADIAIGNDHIADFRQSTGLGIVLRSRLGLRLGVSEAVIILAIGQRHDIASRRIEGDQRNFELFLGNITPDIDRHGHFFALAKSSFSESKPSG